jgi:hypothetical protein
MDLDQERLGEHSILPTVDRALDYRLVSIRNCV